MKLYEGTPSSFDEYSFLYVGPLVFWKFRILLVRIGHQNNDGNLIIL